MTPKLSRREPGNYGNLPVVTAATRYAGKRGEFPWFPGSRVTKVIP